MSDDTEAIREPLQRWLAERLPGAEHLRVGEFERPTGGFSAGAMPGAGSPARPSDGSSPSGANQQPWRFVVISDAEIKSQIRQASEKIERRFYERNATQADFEED